MGVITLPPFPNRECGCAKGAWPKPGRVEDWRASIRVRWVLHHFRNGPQSGSHRHVSSPRRFKPYVRFSLIRLTDNLQLVACETWIVRPITTDHMRPGPNNLPLLAVKHSLRRSYRDL